MHDAQNALQTCFPFFTAHQNACFGPTIGGPVTMGTMCSQHGASNPAWLVKPGWIQRRRSFGITCSNRCKVAMRNPSGNSRDGTHFICWQARGAHSTLWLLTLCVFLVLALIVVRVVPGMTYVQHNHVTTLPCHYSILQVQFILDMPRAPCKLTAFGTRAILHITSTRCPPCHGSSTTGAKVATKGFDGLA